MTGEEKPPPTGKRHLGWTSLGNTKGLADETTACPVRSGPRHCGQSLADRVTAEETKERTARAPSRSRDRVFIDTNLGSRSQRVRQQVSWDGTLNPHPHAVIKSRSTPRVRLVNRSHKSVPSLPSQPSAFSPPTGP